MNRLLRQAEDLTWGALSLIVALIVAVFLLRSLARYTPAPISTAAQFAGRSAGLTGF